MAIIKAINSKSSISKIINYVANKEKTTEELMYGKDCSSEPEQAIEDMTMTKELYNKTDGRLYKHFVQSFKHEDNISPEEANKIAREWAEKVFKGHEVFIATHTDKKHVHNHFVVNSVNFENGKKLVYSNKELQKYKDISDRICEREGLSLAETKENTLTSFNTQKYKALEKGAEGKYKSYMLELWKNVNSSMKIATSKEQFISLMNKKGYQVKWSDSRKYITYVPPKGRPIRDSNLAKTFKNEKLSKEGLLDEFRRNSERVQHRGAERNNNEIIRDTKDIGKAIMFNQYGGNEVSSSRDDQFIKADKTEQRETGTINRTVESREEVGRAENSRIYTEVGQGDSRTTTGNGRLEGKQLQEPKDFDRNTDERQEDNRGLDKQVSRNIERHQEHGEGKDMERQSNPIFDTTRDNNRIDIDDNRSISSDNLLDKIVSRFKNPLKKVEEKKKAEEKAKAELEKKKKNITKNKTIKKDWTRER